MALVIDNIYFGWWHEGRFLLETTLGGEIKYGGVVMHVLV